MEGAHPLFGATTEEVEEAAEKLSVDLAAHRSWRLSVEMKWSHRSLIAPPEEIARRASNSASALELRSMADVRLYFPNTNLELWTTQALLVNSSPHFATLFASGFAETVAARPKRRRIDAASPTATAEMDDEILLNDSDDEADGIYLKGKSATVDAGDTEYREIKITSAAYSTYKAVLTYLCTSHITFAPLLRSCRPDDEASRLELLERFHSSHSSHPIPVSPKSVYRLAHYLELPHLQALAFQAFKSQLTSEFLAHELVSSTVERYEELKEVVLAAAATEWEQVRQGAAMEEVTEAMAEDEKMAARYGRMLGDLIRRKEL